MNEYFDAPPRVATVLATVGLQRERDVVTAFTETGSGYDVLRRVDDIVELASSSAAVNVDLVLVSPRFPRLSYEVLVALARGGATLVALVDVGDEVAHRRAHQWGQSAVVVRDGENVAQNLATNQLLALGDRSTVSDQWSNRGRLVVVCGPPGTTGRSAVAVNLAAELPGANLVIDAHVGAASMAFQLGVAAEPAGLIAVCAQAERGLLDVDGLRAACVTFKDQIHVCTGIEHQHRAPEVTTGAIGMVARMAQRTFATTVIDLGVQPDIGDIAAMADLVIVTASPSAVGIHRLERWLRAFDEDLPANPVLIWNGIGRGRDSALGKDPVQRLAHVVPRTRNMRVFGISWDKAAARAMDQRAGTLGVVASRSVLRRTIAGVAQAILPEMSKSPQIVGPQQNRTPRHTGARGPD